MRGVCPTPSVLHAYALSEAIPDGRVQGSQGVKVAVPRVIWFLATYPDGQVEMVAAGEPSIPNFTAVVGITSEVKNAKLLLPKSMLLKSFLY